MQASRFVTSQILGLDMSGFEFQFFARDAADYFRQTARKVDALGGGFLGPR